jgi:hypothetical protein
VAFPDQMEFHSPMLGECVATSYSLQRMNYL